MKKDKFTLGVMLVCFVGILSLALAKVDRDKKAIAPLLVIHEESEAYTEEETQSDILQRVNEYSAQLTRPDIISLYVDIETQTETEICATMPEICTTTALEAQTTIEDDTFITETQEEQSSPILVQNTACVSLTAEEENLLVRVASLEAGNQGWQGMALVMNVILNRRQAWGKSITELVYDKGQFSVVGCEKWNNGFTVSESLTALAVVKNGWDGSQGALFFCAPSDRSQWMATTKQYLFTAWGHEFYK